MNESLKASNGCGQIDQRCRLLRRDFARSSRTAGRLERNWFFRLEPWYVAPLSEARSSKVWHAAQPIQLRGSNWVKGVANLRGRLMPVMDGGYSGTSFGGAPTAAGGGGWWH